MADTIFGMEVQWDEIDHQAFERDIEAIVRKYGDQPHLRRRRDAEFEQATAVFMQCCRFVVVPVDG